MKGKVKVRASTSGGSPEYEDLLRQGVALYELMAEVANKKTLWERIKSYFSKDNLG